MKKSSLNHCYRLIWNRCQQAWMPVAEHVKSDGKSTGKALVAVKAEQRVKSSTRFNFTKKMQIALLVASTLFGASQYAHAQWKNVTIQSGQASILQLDKHLSINVSSQQVIASASSLDIGTHERVNIAFAQSGGNGLFRSTGNTATNIMGSLTSNGNLFLINPNGVMFGQEAQVNVGSLVASSMDISNADFLNGNYKFNANGSTAGVENQGLIQVSDGGYLVMLGKEVSNSGTLVANNGSVVMAAAESATLDFYGNGLVKANLSGDALEAVVTQAGHVQADGGAVQLATSSRSSAINVSGITQANSLVKRNGVIRLEGGNHAQVSVSGTLAATGNQAGSTGGHIAVTGEQVALFNGATLDASGVAGGGQVLVGGDYQGNNDAVYNARTTYVDQEASINVDAKQTGDAGKVIVWADQTTRYYGDISAKGGAESGDGGFVEVSGKKNLGFHGVVDVSATNGEGGKVLLDPENIVLNNSTQAPPTDNATGTPDIAFSDAPDPGTTTVQINDVRGFSELHLQATNDITVDNTLTMNTNNSVHLEANNDIHINAAVSTSGTGAVELTANNDINVNQRVTVNGTGKVTMNADADNSGAGNLNVNQRIYARSGGIALSGFNVQSATTAGYIQTQSLVGTPKGDIAINATNAVNLAGSIITYGRNGADGVDGTDAGDIAITAGGAIATGSIAAYGGRAGTSNANAGDAGNITIASTGAGDINTGNVNARNGRGNGSGLGGATGSINIQNTAGNINTLSLNVSGDTNGVGGVIDIDAIAGDVTVTGDVSAQGGTTAAGSALSGRAGGDIDIDASGDVTVTKNIYAHGAAANTANTAVGGNGGTVDITGKDLTFNNVVYAYGNIGRGVGSAGGNADAGNAGAVSINSTGAGDISTGNVYVQNGAARGTGAGGATGTVTIKNTDGNIATKNLYAHGNLNGNAGAIDIDAVAGDVTVTGGVYAHGGTTAAGSTAAGGTGGTIDIDASGDVTVTSRVYAQGGGVNAANRAAGGNAGTINVDGKDLTFNNVVYAYGNNGRGVDSAGGNGGAINLNATGAVTAENRIYAYGGNGGGTNDLANTAVGGNAGLVAISSSGAGDITLNQDVNVRTGYSRGSAVGATAGSIDITNADGNITTKNIRAEGQNHGDGSSVTIDPALTGNVNVNGVIYTYGDRDPTAASKVGTNAGDITVKGAAVTIVNTISADGGRSTGVAGEVGGNAGDIKIESSGLVSTKAIVANGGNAGTTTNAAGGNAGNVSIHSSGTGDIDMTTVSARTGYTRGNTATATGAGSVTIENDDGKLTATSISTRGQRRGVGGEVLAISAGDFNVTTVDARSSNLTAADDGDITIGTKTTGDTTVNTVLTQARWLVYSGDPRNDTIGAFKPTADFKQYNTHYGGALLDTGNGFVYRHAPVINSTLTGSASKVYDANTNVNSIAGLTFNQGAAIDGDVVTLSGFTSATYDNKNAGTGKTLTSNAVTVAVAGQSNGTTKVYGYQAAAATGGVGVITPRDIDINVDAGQQKIEGNADPLPFTYTVGGLGLVGGETLTGNLNRDGGETAGSYAINQGSLDAGSNYNVTYVGGVFNVVADANPVGSPRTTAGLGGVIDVRSQPQSLVVLNVDPTAAGGYLSDICSDDQGGASNNPNAAVMLNFGVSLPEGVSKTCISDVPSS